MNLGVKLTVNLRVDFLPISPPLVALPTCVNNDNKKAPELQFRDL